MDVSDYAALLRRVSQPAAAGGLRISADPKTAPEGAAGLHFALFSRSGFTHRLLDLAARKPDEAPPPLLLLVDLPNMYE